VPAKAILQGKRGTKPRPILGITSCHTSYADRRPHGPDCPSIFVDGMGRSGIVYAGHQQAQFFFSNRSFAASRNAMTLTVGILTANRSLSAELSYHSTDQPAGSTCPDHAGDIICLWMIRRIRIRRHGRFDRISQQVRVAFRSRGAKTIFCWLRRKFFGRRFGLGGGARRNVPSFSDSVRFDRRRRCPSADRMRGVGRGSL